MSQKWHRIGKILCRKSCRYLESRKKGRSPGDTSRISTWYINSEIRQYIRKYNEKRGKMDTDKLKELEAEIQKGNADAMNDLGALYYEGGSGLEQSFEKAMFYYKMAAEHGSRQAQENLGYCYYYGRNGELPDYEKAFHYFALGAFDGHLISLYKIGDMYLNGYYVEKNEPEAFYIFLHCLNTMSEEAETRVAGPVFLRLGKMLAEGIGCEKDLKGALVSFQRAEFYLREMVLDGDVMYKKSLREAVAGQNAVREQLDSEMPGETWGFDG